MIVGHTDGTLSYYKNMAANDSVTPNWQLQQLELTDMNGDTINVGGNAAPFIYDIDKDGKPDLVIGSVYGYIVYYQNVSTIPGTISLKLVNSQLGGAKVDPVHNYGSFSTIFFGKIDTTGVDYLLMGSNSGLIYQFTGFQSGDTTATYTLVTPNYCGIDTMHNYYYYANIALSSSYGVFDNLRSAPVVGDIAGDGNLEMLVGEVKGGVQLYKRKLANTGVPTVSHSEHSILVYPNPANETLNVSWSDVSQQMVQISVLNMEGQILYTTTAAATQLHTAIPVSMLPPGMYACMVQSGVNRYYSKFTKNP